MDAARSRRGSRRQTANFQVPSRSIPFPRQPRVCWRKTVCNTLPRQASRRSFWRCRRPTRKLHSAASTPPRRRERRQRWLATIRRCKTQSSATRTLPHRHGLARKPRLRRSRTRPCCRRRRRSRQRRPSLQHRPQRQRHPSLSRQPGHRFPAQRRHQLSLRRRPSPRPQRSPTRRPPHPARHSRVLQPLLRLRVRRRRTRRATPRPRRQPLHRATPPLRPLAILPRQPRRLHRRGLRLPLWCPMAGTVWWERSVAPGIV